ncbi:hypothetical protein GCM10017783_26000 [Deinococcus piscis]|uniref:HTH tetR-type domain-containing protein n=1 Tax=Deinococcus piscis TaxID=394230 RepID=A0ABQ3KBM8_9DEIO|nr:TetR/AcrR family transcriptional regulator [Deinococcus piscis]GHG12845.1 hypothetical protein GCM10017783_26000 [Deinococcus piscis]
MALPHSRRDRHKQERLERIKRAAWELFSTQGYESTTVRQIAEQADVSAATVIQHAGDKAELLLLVFNEAIGQRIKNLDVPENASLDVTMLRVFRPFLSFYQEYPELSRAFLREFLYGKSRWQEQEIRQAEQFIGFLTGIVKTCQGRGEVRKDADPLLLGQLFFLLYR